MENELKTGSFDIFDSAIKRAIYKFRDMNCYEDLYQECYMKILDILHNDPYNPIYNLYGYAYSIARNTVTQYLYHYKKLVPVEDDLLEVQLTTDVDFDSDIYVEDCLEVLMNQYRDVLGTRTMQYLKDLISNETTNLVDTVIKGELLWMLSKNKDREVSITYGIK
jgi:DNA-directed RNA polymerase specialized sigma24 family protein